MCKHNQNQNGGEGVNMVVGVLFINSVGCIWDGCNGQNGGGSYGMGVSLIGGVRVGVLLMGVGSQLPYPMIRSIRSHTLQGCNLF